MKKSLSILCTILLVAACVISSCGKKKNAEMPQVKYETKVLQSESRTYNMTFPATLSGTSEVKVYPQVEGIIKKKTSPAAPTCAKGRYSSSLTRRNTG